MSTNGTFSGLPPSVKRAEGTTPVIRIRPARGWISSDLHEAWLYRDLLYFLCIRSIKVRYKQTVLGAGWAVGQPLVTMVILSLVFGRLVGMPSDGISYPLFAYAGLWPWQLLAQSLVESGNSIVSNEHLIKKVYFPRLLIPLSTVLTSLVDFAVAGLLLAGMMAYGGIAPTARLFALPLLVVLVVTLVLGVGLWLSALNVRYRDVRHAIPLLTQCWLLATPIAYPASLLSDKWRPLLFLNPMAGVVEGFRSALFGTGSLLTAGIGLSAAVAAGLLVSGVTYFRRMERTFADVL